MPLGQRRRQRRRIVSRRDPRPAIRSRRPAPSPHARDVAGQGRDAVRRGLQHHLSPPLRVRRADVQPRAVEHRRPSRPRRGSRARGRRRPSPSSLDQVRDRRQLGSRSRRRRATRPGRRGVHAREGAQRRRRPACAATTRPSTTTRSPGAGSAVAATRLGRSVPLWTTRTSPRHPSCVAHLGDGRLRDRDRRDAGGRRSGISRRSRNRPRSGHRPAHGEPELLLVDVVDDQHDRRPAAHEQRGERRDAAVHVEDHVEPPAAQPLAQQPSPDARRRRRTGRRGGVRRSRRGSRGRDCPRSRAVQNSTSAPASRSARATSQAYRSLPPASRCQGSRQLTTTTRVATQAAVGRVTPRRRGRARGAHRAAGGHVGDGRLAPEPARDDGELPEREGPVPRRLEGRARDVVPGHRELDDPGAPSLRAGEDLDVEGEAGRTQVREDRAGEVAAEDLEAALGVGDAGGDLLGAAPVERGAPDPDRAVPLGRDRPGHRPGPDRDVGALRRSRARASWSASRWVAPSASMKPTRSAVVCRIPSRTAAPLPGVSQRTTRTGIAAVCAAAASRAVSSVLPLSTTITSSAAGDSPAASTWARSASSVRGSRAASLRAGMTSCMSRGSRAGGPDQLSAYE